MNASAAAPTNIDIAFVADQNYLFPLSVCLSSILQYASANEQFQFFIAYEQVSSQARMQIEATIPAPHAIRWISVASDNLNSVVVSEHITRTSYIRLLLPEILPADLARVLYLDADILVQGSLLPLWTTQLNSFAFAAVRDRFVQTVDSDPWTA